MNVRSAGKKVTVPAHATTNLAQRAINARPRRVLRSAAERERRDSNPLYGALLVVIRLYSVGRVV